jgi:putative endonuclease
MYKVYILQSLKDKRTYVGYTDNLNRRLFEHNSGRNKSTKNRVPFKLLFSEDFESRKEAKKRELWWKTGAGRNKLKEFFRYNQMPP